MLAIRPSAKNASQPEEVTIFIPVFFTFEFSVDAFEKSAKFCSDWLEFVFVNLLTIGNSENKDIKTQQYIYYPVITDTKLAKPGKLSLEYRVRFRLIDQLLLNEVKDSFHLGFR
jgi:hypothetical protein